MGGKIGRALLQLPRGCGRRGERKEELESEWVVVTNVGGSCSLVTLAEVSESRAVD